MQIFLSPLPLDEKLNKDFNRQVNPTSVMNKIASEFLCIKYSQYINFEDEMLTKQMFLKSNWQNLM